MVLACLVLGVGAFLLWMALASPPFPDGCPGLSGNYSHCVSTGAVFDPIPYVLGAGTVCVIIGAVWLALVARTALTPVT